jgi:hypothetical protein
MKTRTLLLTVLILGAPLAVGAQQPPVQEGAVIDSVELRGISPDQLSRTLLDDINGLVGQRPTADAVNALVARIEAEHRDMVAAVRESRTPNGTAHVVFVVARIVDDAELSTNINARYIVEAVEIRGIDEDRISRNLRDELQKLVGRPLDNDEADALADRLEAEQPDYNVGRRVSRGRDRQLRVIFRFELSEDRLWVPRPPARSKLVFHGDQGWSGAVDISASGDGIAIGPSVGGRHQVTFGFAWSNQDDLLEEYAAQRIRFVTRMAGNRRLGLSFELTRFTNDWHDATLEALAANVSIPAAYRKRVTVEPVVTFAPTRYASVTAGVSVSDLDALTDGLPTQSARVATASASFDRTRRSDFEPRGNDVIERRQRLRAHYDLRAGVDVLDSDFVYRRHAVGVSYAYRYDSNEVLVHTQYGHLTGDAPLFERFTLGDTATLRGWNKFDLAPAGAVRMMHHSIEYRFHHFAYFVDAGSLWAPGEEIKVRLATGIGLHGEHAFLTVGFPLNGGRADATFMMGLRANWGSLRWGF